MRPLLFFLVALTAVRLSFAQVSPDSAQYHIGEMTTICGQVAGTHLTKAGMTFINFGKGYPNQSFVGVIMAKDSQNFKEWRPVDYLKGKKVCVMGTVKQYNGKPEIIIKSPTQIRFPE